MRESGSSSRRSREFLVVENLENPPDRRRYRLPAGYAEVLTNEESMNYLGP